MGKSFRPRLTNRYPRPDRVRGVTLPVRPNGRDGLRSIRGGHSGEGRRAAATTRFSQVPHRRVGDLRVARAAPDKPLDQACRDSRDTPVLCRPRRRR